jgi:hydrogenase/urease accessory protein HupE
MWSVCVAKAFGHDSGLSTVRISLNEARIEVSATYARKEIEASSGTQQGLAEIALDPLVLEKNRTRLRPAYSETRFDAQNNVEFRLSYDPGSDGRLTVRSPLIAKLAPGHRQLLTVTDSHGRVLAERLLKADQDCAELEIESRSARTTSFAAFVALGVEHILTGYDHLLFLVALLIVTRSFMQSLKTITCFTAAHSVALALATFNVVQIPGRIVESLIAASIVYVSVENLVRRAEPRRRWLLTFAFGLIHGLGFASVLREMGIGSRGSGIVLPLLSFNLGVELGQILVAAVLLPLLWKVGERPVFVRRWVPACSILVTLAGSCWLVQRMWCN